MTDMEKWLSDDNILNIYPFGSQVYGSQSAQSDEDWILICREWFDSQNQNVTVYTVPDFQMKVDNMEIKALECIFLPVERVPKHKFWFNIGFHLKKSKLREEISKTRSNSWAKGQKKIVVENDVYAGIKSIFHSLRIIDFGIQIANNGRIINYGSLNWLLEELRKMSQVAQGQALWGLIKSKYHEMYNTQSSRFKALCSKPMHRQEQEQKLKNLLKKFGVENSVLVNELFSFFNQES